MKYFIIVLSLCCCYSSVLISKEVKDSLEKVEVFCKWWSCCDCETYDLEQLSGDNYSFKSSFIIVITNPNILSDLSYCINSSEKISGSHKVDYVISMLCFYNNRTDTVSFNKKFSILRINSNYFRFNWGLLYLLLDTFPQHYYNKVYGELLMRKYYER